MSNLPTGFGQIRDQAALLAPPFLNDREFGQRFLYAMTRMSDMLLEKAYQATTIRIPGAGDPSQIPYLANDRVLVQGPAEPSASFDHRLQTAFQAWQKAGSRLSALGQLQAYLQGLQPGVAAALPEMVIVGGNASITTWDTIYNGTPLGGASYHTTISPANWNWDGSYKPWRSWLVLFMAQVPTGQSGTGASIVGSGTGSLPGGQNVGGVWVPATSGTAVNSPYLTIGSMAGLVPGNAGQWLTLFGGAHAANNITSPILSVLSSTSCVVANPNGVVGDTVSWSIGSYPYIGPGPTWGSSGVHFGQGENTTPPLDFGSSVGGVWQPTTSGLTYQPSLSWGLTCSSQVVQSIREILKRWKGAGAYYPKIIVAFDGGDSTAGHAYSPNSSTGAGNPDGTFGGNGKLVAGVWVPSGQVTSAYDAWCQGTGQALGCTVENTT